MKNKFTNIVVTTIVAMSVLLLAFTSSKNSVATKKAAITTVCPKDDCPPTPECPADCCKDKCKDKGE